MRTAPLTISTRLTKQQRDHVEVMARARGYTISDVMRHAILSLAQAGTEAPDGLLRQLLEALELDPATVTSEEIVAEIERLLAEMAEPEPEPAEEAEEEEEAPADPAPLAENADPPAPKPGEKDAQAAAGNRYKLSKDELAFCAAHGESHAAFYLRKANAVRRRFIKGTALKAAPRALSKYKPAPLTADERTACGKAGVSESVYLARKAAAARRR